jgi:hypothetical protein
VVLSKENHMQLTEAATLDRKSGEAEGSAVRHSCAPPLPAHNLSFVILRACDFFDLVVFSAYPASCFKPPDKAVILSVIWAWGPPKWMKIGQRRA